MEVLRAIARCLIIWLAVGPSPGQAVLRIPAFPGAEGFGAFTPGGRQGQIVLVTTLDDYHPQRDKPIPGSLRWARTMADPRIVIFRVSGTIVLNDKLVITEPFITIAGAERAGRRYMFAQLFDGHRRAPN